MGAIDLHVDSIIVQRLFRYRVVKKHGAGLRGQPLFWHADVPRMVEAGYRGACMGIHYYPWESERGWAESQRQIDYLDEVIGADPHVLRVREPADWARAPEQNKIAIAPGVEGAHMLNGQIDRVAELGRRGVAYMTLTHFSKNAAATPSMGRGHNETDGLTAFGRDVVQALEEHDVIVDLAHVNMPGVLGACEVATRPVFCTHTGAKGVHDVARNVSDEAIDAIAELDGVIGIIFAPNFLTGRLRADSNCVVDHIEYVIDRVGVRHVALGSDYDGWLPAIPSDMRDCRDIGVIGDLMRGRGHDEETIERVYYRNAQELLSRHRGGGVSGGGGK